MTENQFIYNQELVQISEKKTFEITDSFHVMQNAGFICHSFILNNFSPKKILVLCGPGNNGGDGALIAHYLFKKNTSVNINYPFGLPKTKDSKKALKSLKNKIKVKKNILFKEYDLIIDALFGTGINKILKPSMISFIKKLNQSKINVVSIDMPSGVFTDTGQIQQTAVKANITLSLHRFKPGQWLLPGKEFCGKTVLLDIGLANIDEKCFLKFNYPITLPKLSLAANKFSRGSCFVLADKNLVGAPKLAFLSSTQSALRAGAGLCKLIVNEKYVNFYKLHIMEEMILTYKNIKDFISTFENQKCNTIVYGCGIENNTINKKILTFLLTKKVNLVLDAISFSLIHESKNEFFDLLNHRTKTTVMTPHAGEFKRLFKISNNKINDCLNAAKKSNSIIVYKGNDTVIGTPEGLCFMNKESSPYLATAGSGDILAGLIGGFLAQNIDGLTSTRLGCYIHSRCGKNLGAGLTAEDLVKEIPNVMKTLIDCN